MCSLFSDEETVTVVYTETEARDLLALLQKTATLARKFKWRLGVIDAQRAEKRMRDLGWNNWSA